jgi:acetyl-CoA synthetase
MELMSRFLDRTEFKNYEDYYENFKIKIPEGFNFSYDVVDIIAAENPNKIAMVWCDDQGREEKFTFSQVRNNSNKAANFFKDQGLI